MISPFNPVTPQPRPASSLAPQAPAAVAPVKPSVGHDNGWVRHVQGPMLRSAARFPFLSNMVESLTRSGEPLPKADGPINQHTVVPGVLLRGGQRSLGGLARLASTDHPSVILNLAAEYPQNRTGEATTATALGITPRQLLLNPMSAPTPAQADAFIAQVDAQQQAVDAARKAGKPVPGPLYVHCYAGSDRTGAMVACYRVARMGWTADQAIAEMRQYGANSAMHPDFEPMVRAFAASHGLRSS